MEIWTGESGPDRFDPFFEPAKRVEQNWHIETCLSQMPHEGETFLFIFIRVCLMFGRPSRAFISSLRIKVDSDGFVLLYAPEMKAVI